MQNDDQGAAPTGASVLGVDGVRAEAGGVRPESGASGGEIVFIDTSVDDWQTLADGVDPAAEVALVGPDQDGMQVMADTLAGRSGVNAIHVIGHGDVGLFDLGSARVDASTLSDYATEMAVIGEALSEDADLLLYGCYIGADGAGLEFVDRLATTTGADVAASDDLTGASELGGDWTLEVSSGNIESDVTAIALNVGSFAGVLPVTPGTINFSGVGNVESDPSANGINFDGWQGETNFGNPAPEIDAQSTTTDPDTTGARFVSADGSSFQFNGLDIDGFTGSPIDVTFTGYLSNSQVSGASYTLTVDATEQVWQSVSASDLGSNFDNVDEVRISRVQPYRRLRSALPLTT